MDSEVKLDGLFSVSETAADWPLDETGLPVAAYLMQLFLYIVE